MRKPTIIVLAAVVSVTILCISWRVSGASEPAYDGKRISIWLDELSRVDPGLWPLEGVEQLKAVRTMGTNAIPWLLKEHRRAQSKSDWRLELNRLLMDQQAIRFRFLDRYGRHRRATVGFSALGELAQPAIPELLSMVDAKDPTPVVRSLAAIGFEAIPALKSCLTNLSPYTNRQGVFVVIPGETIRAIFLFSPICRMRPKTSVAALFPEIEAWALQTTNQDAQSSARFFLDSWQPERGSTTNTPIAPDSKPPDVAPDEVNSLTGEHVIRIAQQQALLKGLDNREVAFAAYDTNSTTWWVGIKSKTEDPLSLATVGISKDGEKVTYLPPGHKITAVEAGELSKRAVKSKAGGTEFVVTYSRKQGDIWFVGIKVDPRVYGGGSQSEVRLGPTGRLISVTRTTSGPRL